jgi:hypothetical protein
MKRNIARTTLLMVSEMMLLVTLAATARAEGPQCSPALTAGKWGFTTDGTIIGVGPRVALALLTLDAAGNVKGKVSASLNGNVTHTTLSGTYTVNPDCTGALSFSEYDLSGNLAFTGTVDLVWDDSMQELRFIFTSAKLPDGTLIGTVIGGSARKLVVQSGDSQ